MSNYIPDLTERYPEGFRSSCDDDFEVYAVYPLSQVDKYHAKLFKSFSKAYAYAKQLTALGIDNTLNFADETDIKIISNTEESLRRVKYE